MIDDFIRKEILRNMINNNSTNINFSVIGNSTHGMSYSSLMITNILSDYFKRKNCEVMTVCDAQL